MNEMNNEKKAVKETDADYVRYLAYQEAIKSLRGNANGGK